MLGSTLAEKFFTGVSPGLAANVHFVNAMVAASRHCDLQASEHIYDVNGMLLWAGGKPIDDRLLERLIDRPLRKPIELCVQARDPVASVAASDSLTRLLQGHEDLTGLLAPQLDHVQKALRRTVPNPVELMFIAVMRHGGLDRVDHAVLVAAIAVSVAEKLGVPDTLQTLIAQAALLHDVGELYLPESLSFSDRRYDAAALSHYRHHVVLGAQIATEVTRSGAVVASLISGSHERLDGWGYPRGLQRADQTVPAQALAFAEAVASHLQHADRNRLRRAAVAMRVLPGEFERGMVDWLSAAAKGRPVDVDPDSFPERIEPELRQLHLVLSRIMALFAEPHRETTLAMRHIDAWRLRFDQLTGVLRASGVDEAFAQGIGLNVDDTQEALELASTCAELRERMRWARFRIESQRDEVPDLGASIFTQELIEALSAAEIELAQPGAECGRGEAFPWSRIFCVGVQEIDEQHQTIVRMINRLYDSTGNAPGSADARRDVILGLADYVREHFATEERLMARYAYAESEQHHREHEALTKSVGALLENLNHGQMPDLDALIAFLRHWLIVHILQSDMALGRALTAAGQR